MPPTVIRVENIVVKVLGIVLLSFAAASVAQASFVLPALLPVKSVPEIDGSGIVVGLALLAGGLAVLLGRRIKRG